MYCLWTAGLWTEWNNLISCMKLCNNYKEIRQTTQYTSLDLWKVQLNLNYLISSRNRIDWNTQGSLRELLATNRGFAWWHHVTFCHAHLWYHCTLCHIENVLVLLTAWSIFCCSTSARLHRASKLQEKLYYEIY